MSQLEIVACLGRLEGVFLDGLQQIRQIREELERREVEGGKLEKLLDAQEVAKILGVEVDYVYALARKKKIPSIRVGEKYVKFSPAQIKEFLVTAKPNRSQPRAG